MTCEVVRNHARSLRFEESRASGWRPIWEVIIDRMKDVPDEVLERLLEDGASQGDHYIYGLRRIKIGRACLRPRWFRLRSSRPYTRWPADFENLAP